MFHLSYQQCPGLGSLLTANLMVLTLYPVRWVCRFSVTFRSVFSCKLLVFQPRGTEMGLWNSVYEQAESVFLSWGGNSSSNFLIFISCPAYDLSWRMFHVYLKRMCNLLLLNGMLCKYQFKLIWSNVSFKGCVSLLISLSKWTVHW